jgi:hypothetical protein
MNERFDQWTQREGLASGKAKPVDSGINIRIIARAYLPPLPEAGTSTLRLFASAAHQRSSSG